MVSPKAKKVLLWCGGACTIVGLIDLPDQIQRWIKFFQSLAGQDVNWEIDIFGNLGRWLFTIGGIIMLLLAYDVPSKLRSRWQKVKLPPVDSSAADLPPGFMWLKDAAEKLYTYTRGKKHVLSRIAEELSGWKNGRTTDGSPEDILDYMATYIAFCKRVPLCGKRAPSTAFEAISFDEVRACHFVSGATKLERTYNKSIYFTDLAVKSDAFNDLMANVQMDDGYYDPKS